MQNESKARATNNKTLTISEAEMLGSFKHIQTLVNQCIC